VALTRRSGVERRCNEAANLRGDTTTEHGVIESPQVYGERYMHPKEEQQSSSAWLKRISAFFSHAFIIAVLGGILIGLFQHNQSAKQERLARKEQLQDRQYTLLANFSNQFDQYMVLLINLRYLQITINQPKTNLRPTDFIGRSRAETLPVYREVVKHMMEQPRGEAVLVSIKALFRSPEVSKQVDELDKEVLALQHGGPDDGNLTEDQVRAMDKDIEQRVRRLAVAMRQEMEADK
jgi:murein L,D-transpeptidase YcbB/YkuD